MGELLTENKNKMKTISSILGYTIALGSMLLVIILFPGLGSFSKKMAELPFMKVHPIYSGGEIKDTINKKSYSIYTHQPVFKSFPKKKETGFVQITLEGDSITYSADTIDYNRDGTDDFSIFFRQEKPKISVFPASNEVTAIKTFAKTEEGYIIRILLNRNGKPDPDKK